MARRTLGDRQERFQIGFPREIEGHWVGVETGKVWEGPDDGAFKVGVGEAAAIGGAEEPAVRHETSGGQLDEISVILLGPEDMALVVAGEGGGIEDDPIEGAALFRKTTEPVKGVPLAKVLGLGIEVVEAEILASPVEVGLRKIEGGGESPGQGRAHREGARVGEGIENGVTRLASLPHAAAVVALIKEDALGITGLKTDTVAHPFLENVKRLRLFRAREVGGGFLLMLIESLPIGGMTTLDRPAFEFGREHGFLGGDQPPAGEIVDVNPR